MNAEELPMILFTVIGQMSVGSIWILGLIHIYGYAKKMKPETIDRITNAAMYAAGPLLVLGFFAAFFHLGDPFNALNTLRHMGSSWMSREIGAGVLYGAVGLVFAACQWMGWFSRWVRQVLAGLTALAGLLLVITMAGVYFSVETIPAWHNASVWIFFFSSAILTGSLAVGVALMVTWNMQARRDAGGEAKLAHKLRLISDKPLTSELTALTTKALQGISLSAAFAGVVILVTYPVYIGWLGTGDAAAQEVAHHMQGPVLVVRLVLLAAVVIMTGMFAFMRARTAEKPNRAIAWIIGIAFALAIASELLGRGLHYEGLWHVGLNTTQYILGQ
ncbi:MAG: dimethyl sulfoxide reductase anchor subunit family protein [Ancrocorticia sp.]|uniref:dimethyl sulfoxide reductase anchor subunit family protein n=1 Tax=Ancrocorticia sp. TaxID=2593684 RepID=UPI003F912B58